jgi:hypothetical protein
MNIPQNTNTHRPSFWLRAIELRKHELTREYRRGLGDKAREGVSDEDYATTVATLEKMARNLGWDEDDRPERPFGRFGRRHPAMMRAHGFGPKRHHPRDEA